MRARARGYSLLIVMVILAAASLLVFMTVELGGSEVDQTTLGTHDAQALAAAEVGLERTRAYLSAIADSDLDFDRALDPGLDDVCTVGASFAVMDPNALFPDHLPTFTDGDVVTLAGWAGSEKAQFRRVVWAPSGTPLGAYLVRIDDNDDDQGFGLPIATLTTGSGNCVEGPVALPAPLSNPVRDRDRMVMVSVIGLAPGSDPDTAKVRRVIRALVGKKEMPGILAGGPVSMSGSTEACGPFANLEATGAVNLNEMGSTCALCDHRQSALTSSSTCSRTDSGLCNADAPPPTVPLVDPYDVKWRPASCVAPPCTPFYRLTTGPQLSMWNYAAAGCSDPKLAPACFPGPCACWNDVSATTLNAGGELYLNDLDPALNQLTPVPADHRPGPPLNQQYRVFRHEADQPSIPCVPQNLPGAVFRYDPGATLPHGVWLVEGKVRLDATVPPGLCPNAVLLVHGSVEVRNGIYRLGPLRSAGAALVASGDLDFQTGNADLTTCHTGAAIAVHEQVVGSGNSLIEAPLLVEDAATCTSEVVGLAINFGGNFTVKVEDLPLLSVAPLTTFSWSESSY